MTQQQHKQGTKDLSEEDLERIEKIREQRRLERQKEQESGGEYGLMCPACDKPNNLQQSFCTGCSFQLDAEADRVRLPKNIFMSILLGETDTKILYQDDMYAVFDDKYPVSRHHLESIPTRVIEDITHLTSEDIPLVEGLYQCALRELRGREDVKQRFNVDKLEEYLVCGFNFPVSVKHLHLHVVLPPFKHRKVFIYPRWHSYAKVLRDLRERGRVTTYDMEPNDEEGQAEYERAMRLHEEFGGE